MLWLKTPRIVALALLLGACVTSDVYTATANAGNCAFCQVGPYRTSYGFGHRHRYAGGRSIYGYRTYRQPFGSAHPRSLIGRPGSGFSYGLSPYVGSYGFAPNVGGYASTLISRGRFGGAFPYRVSTSTLRFGRSFGIQRGISLPRYRVYFGQSTPGLSPASQGGFQFVSTQGSAHLVPADEGWIMLADGNAMDAIAAFDKRITDNPGNRLAKVGLALSLAAAGDLTAGAWHMRQACSGDPNVLKVVDLDSFLRHQIHELMHAYKGALAKNNANRQKHFMLASLNYLAGNQKAAATSIATAIRNGDRTPAARYLQELIEAGGRDRDASLVSN